MERLTSSSWYRVAGLRPRLAAGIAFHRHRVRGQTWFVVRDGASRRVHRLSVATHDLLQRLDGQRTVEQAWRAVLDRFADAAPTQDETIQILGRLHGAGLLRGELSPDTQALFARALDEERRERRARHNPISFRVPLLDPDDFLTRWEPFVRPLFSRSFAFLWAAWVAIAGMAALRHASELAVASRSLLEPGSVAALWFAYPVVKALHELGHAFAVKRWGGEVHEMGILFLVFLPVPYVDASAASLFPSKRRRMLVGAAGIAVELFLAAACTLMWLTVEPGPARNAAYAVMLVGGVSTLFFNGNPLLRFDGYYVLADAVEIPNLAAKSSRYVGGIARRLLLGEREAPLPETTPGEASWLAGYAILSFVYRTGVLLGIAFYLAGHFLVLGVVLALATLVTRVLVPLARCAGILLFDPGVGERRARALAGAGGAVLAALLLLFVVPWPLHTRSHGVTWLPERSQVRAGADGFVVELVAEPHAWVSEGQRLMRMHDPTAQARLRRLEAAHRELTLVVAGLEGHDRVEAEIARERLEDATAELALARERSRAVWARSPISGTFVLADGRDPLGRFVRQGAILAHVVDLEAATARVVVPQEHAALLRERTRAAWVRVAHAPGSVLPARIAREVPAATDRLPARALGTAGGGPFAVDPTDPEGLRTLTPIFQLDLALPDGSVVAAGERVWVRFDHGAEPLGLRGWRALRRLFLRQLGV